MDTVSRKLFMGTVKNKNKNKSTKMTPGNWGVIEEGEGREVK